MNETSVSNEHEDGNAAKSDSALSVQIGGGHYKEGSIQPVQYIEANNLGFLEGCVVKRVTRHGRTGGKGRQDIEKAIHELQLLLEIRYPAEQEAEMETLPGPLPASNRTHLDQVSVVDAVIEAFIWLGRLYGDEGERRVLLRTFFREYMQHTGSDVIQPKHAPTIVEKLKEASDLLKRGRINVLMHFDPKFASDTLGVYLTWQEPKTDPQNEKTDSENPKCEATEAKSEATPKFKPGDRAMLEGAEVEVLGRPMSAYASSRPLERWVIRHLSSEAGRRKGLRIIVNENHLQSIPTKTDSATPEPPAAEAKPEDAPYSALAEYLKASVYASANTLPRTVVKYPALGAGYELGEGGIEALWRKLGKFTWVVVKDGVKPYEGYGHGVVKDIVSCTETTGTSTTGEGLRKIVKAVVEFPPSSLPNNAALPQTCTIPVEHLSITIARRDYRKP